MSSRLFGGKKGGGVGIRLSAGGDLRNLFGLDVEEQRLKAGKSGAKARGLQVKENDKANTLTNRPLLPGGRERGD